MGRGAKLPALSKADGPTLLALAVARLRASSSWTHDTSAEDLCEFRPPFGFRDSAGRIKGILWSTPANVSRELNFSIGRRLAAAKVPENETEAYEACLRLATVLKHVTGAPVRREHGTCAVVGSSGGLTGSGQGARIDAHDAVYRFNSAPTGGPYHADVGNRTNVWIASHIPWRAQAKRVAATSADGAEVAALYCFNPWLGSCHVDAMRRTAFATPLLLNPQLAAAMMRIQVALGGKSSGSVRPSTGLVGVGLALASCARVSLFGFGNDSDASMQGHCNHYYECRTNQTNYFAGRMGFHDWHGQWRVLNALAHLGVLKYVAPTGPPNSFTRIPAAPKPARKPSRASRATAAAAARGANKPKAVAKAVAKANGHTPRHQNSSSTGGGRGGGRAATRAAAAAAAGRGGGGGGARRAGAKALSGKVSGSGLNAGPPALSAADLTELAAEDESSAGGARSSA